MYSDIFLIIVNCYIIIIVNNIIFHDIFWMRFIFY